MQLLLKNNSRYTIFTKEELMTIMDKTPADLFPTYIASSVEFLDILGTSEHIATKYVLSFFLLTVAGVTM